MKEDSYHSLQREQNERIKSLETKVDDLEEEVAKYKDKEHESLNQRIRKLEKWIWGAGAVVAAAIAGFGIMEITDFGFQTTTKQVKEHRKFLKETVIPAFELTNWLGKDFTGKPEWSK